MTVDQPVDAEPEPEQEQESQAIAEGGTESDDSPNQIHDDDQRMSGEEEKSVELVQKNPEPENYQGKTFDPEDEV